MVGDKDPPDVATPGQRLPRRFPAPIEAEYQEFNLRVFRPGIRAWHTAALSLALVLLGVGTGMYLAGYRHSVLPLLAARIEPLTLWLIGIAVSIRAALCILSWRKDFVHTYARVAPPLALVGHVCVNAIFASEIFGPHPGYLAATTVYAFGAAILTGLQFRHAMVVNGASLCVLIANGWQHGLPTTAVLSILGHVAFAMAMAGIIALALERAVRGLYLEQRRVGEMASRDGLTGLKNRRSFDEHLRQVWQLALRDKRAIGVMLIDVDFFKSFNDTLGHQAGDAALQSIAEVVAHMARRPLDMSARYGGEELAIILFDVTRDFVTEAAQRVQRQVERLKIAHPKSSVAPVVTVSTGAAFIRPTADRTPQGAIQLADRGLYAAKRAGRNQFTVLDRDFDAITTGVFATSNAPTQRVVAE